MVLSLMVLTLPLGCGDDGGTADSGSTDSGIVDSGVVDSAYDGAARDTGPLYPHELPASADLGTDRRGYTVARSIIHLHSPLSHDACDGQDTLDEATGVGSAECLEQFRYGLCAAHIDVAMLTDHAPYINELPFEELLSAQPGDELIRDEGGAVIASRITCPGDGHQVMLTLGSENELMPVGLRRHVLVGADAEALNEAYDAVGADASDAFREAGALVLKNHPEEDSVAELGAMGLDGIEIFNLHASLDPRTRENLLGLNGADYIAETLIFLDRRRSLAPDLLFLSFFEVSDAYGLRWDGLIADGQDIVGIAGTDAHQNAFSQIMNDGERVDSYRRMMRWFSNHLLIDGDLTPDSIHDALERGRLYVAYEAFGSPVGFDFHAALDAATFEMGDDAPVGATLRVTRPSLPADHPQDPAPSIRMRILRSAPAGAVEVAAGEGATLEYVATEAGSYRAEVFIVPEHTRPFLDGRGDMLIHERPWVQSNHVRVVVVPAPVP